MENLGRLNLRFNGLHLCSNSVHRLRGLKNRSRGPDLCLGIGSFCMMQFVHVGLRVHLEQHVAFFYRGIIFDAHLDDFARHPRLNLRRKP